MEKLGGKGRAAVQHYDMIDEGDQVAVGCLLYTSRCV